MALTLTTDERAELERRLRSLKIRAEDARRARVILMLADGASYSTIEATVPCFRDYINRWRRRFLARPARRAAAAVPRPAADGPDAGDGGARAWRRRGKRRLTAARTGVRASSVVLKIHHNLVGKAWRRAGLQPHRFERYMQSDDPDFETKAADVIGLYLNPPDHAAVFAVDEKTAIQALDRLDPVLPLSPGRAERHGFEYHRHGTLSLFAALKPNPARCSARPFHATPARRLSTSSATSSPAAEAARDPRHPRQPVDPQDPGGAHFLVEHPHVRLHFTPTYSSWLNQVELWFRRSNGTSSRAASSPPSPTWPARSGATSATTTRRRSRSAGLIAIRRIELVVLQRVQATSYIVAGVKRVRFVHGLWSKLQTERGEALQLANTSDPYARIADTSSEEWYAIWLRSHYEHTVERQLSAKGFHTFLPEITTWSTNGRAQAFDPHAHISRLPVRP